MPRPMTASLPFVARLCRRCEGGTERVFSGWRTVSRCASRGQAGGVRRGPEATPSGPCEAARVATRRLRCALAGRPLEAWAGGHAERVERTARDLGQIAQGEASVSRLTVAASRLGDLARDLAA